MEPLEDCPCEECRLRRMFAEQIREIKASLPEPEYDWEYLELKDKEYKEWVQLLRRSTRKT